MSEIIAHNLSKWGIPTRLWRRTSLFRNKTFRAPFGVDDPAKSFFGPEYWHNYYEQDFEYSFNSWGFRDIDFDQYRKENTNQKVNVCIGDSFTLNIGGPREHSWPFLLSKYFDTPTHNISMDGLSSYYFQGAIEKCRQIENVDKVFVLYNIFDDNAISNMKQTMIPASNVYHLLDVLKKHHWVHGAYWQFIPPWTVSESELSDLYKHFPNAHDYLKNTKLGLKDLDVQLLLLAGPLRQKYIEIAGPSWMSYDDFCQLYVCGNNMLHFFDLELDKKLVQDFLTNYIGLAVKKILYTNRDGIHMSRQLNQQLADYFYHQSCTVKLPRLIY